MTEERKQEILEIIRNTNRRPAQTGKPLYPEEIMAYPNLCEEIESISRTVDGFSYRMDILRAKNRGKNCPLFINIHGGGFIGPHRENDTYFSAYMADQIHGIAVDLDYTLSDAAPYPVALHQCMDALDYVAEHANTWGASEKDISVGGYSAGGALTAAMGICCAERGGFVPKLQILCYPPLEYRIPDQYKIDAYDRQIGMERCKAFADLYFDDKKENFEDIHNSPLYAPREILAKQPKTLILSAGLCNFRYEDEDYAICLADAGAEVILKRFPEASHGFIPHFMDGWKEAADLMVREILEK